VQQVEIAGVKDLMNRWKGKPIRTFVHDHDAKASRVLADLDWILRSLSTAIT
jgi:hypothetical protein